MTISDTALSGYGEHAKGILKRKVEQSRSSKCAGSSIIFVHMFKSGGNTLNRIMDWEYDPLRIFSVNGRWRNRGYHQLTRMRPEALSHFQVFRGHMPFGLHRLLAQEATYITLQRDPVERTISEYFSGLNRRIHIHHKIIKGLSLETFVRTFADNNSQTKMIAGLEGYDYLRGECTEEMLAAAKEHLREHFSLVGITARFQETVALAKVIFGWRVRDYADGANLHVTPGRPRQIRPEIREFIEECNSYDVELFRYAVKLFEEALKQHAAEVSEALAGIRLARITHGPQLLLYRGVSSAIRMLTLGHSAIRSVVSVSRSRGILFGPKRAGIISKNQVNTGRYTSYRSAETSMRVRTLR